MVTQTVLAIKKTRHTSPHQKKTQQNNPTIFISVFMLLQWISMDSIAFNGIIQNTKIHVYIHA